MHIIIISYLQLCCSVNLRMRHPLAAPAPVAVVVVVVAVS